MLKIGCYINATKVHTHTTFPTYEPATGRPWAQVADANTSHVDEAVEAARAALNGPWGQLTATARGRLLYRLADLVDHDHDRLAELESRDNGKLLREVHAQIVAVADWLRYFAGAADKVEGQVIPTDKADHLVYTQDMPVGVVAAITPWNSPLLLLTWKLAPALAAGCTVVVKPSEHTSATTVALAELATQAGLPPGVFNVVTGLGPATGRALVSHPGVDKVAFTGSTEVGRAVAAAAAQNFSRTTLELGGKSAQIVFSDADVSAAADGVTAGIFAASGQTCVAGSRLLVQRDIAATMRDAVLERARAIKLGDPRDTTTQMGPVATAEQRQRIHDYLALAEREGATVHHGGQALPNDGYFVAPTILTRLPPSSRLMREEIFGPVLAMAEFDTDEEAVEIANSTAFGLAGSVWTRDLARAHSVAARLHAGTVWVNTYRTVGPQVPFGGVADSGLGRESGLQAIRSYMETKAIWINLSQDARDPFVLG